MSLCDLFCRELERLVGVSSHNSAMDLLGAHFKPILLLIVNASSSLSSSGVGESPVLLWTTNNANYAAFEVNMYATSPVISLCNVWVVWQSLVRQCYRWAWREADIVLGNVIIPLVQPKEQPQKGSYEEIQSSYVRCFVCSICSRGPDC